MGATAFYSTHALKLAASNGSPSVGHCPSALTSFHSRLRILREFERGASPGTAGRMVISGTMADVCAELDRLARTQSTTH